MTDIQTFFKQASEDQALQQELNQALEGKQAEEAARIICKVASKFNFILDMEETTALLKAVAEKYDENQQVYNAELDEEELEGVSGGLSDLYWLRFLFPA